MSLPRDPARPSTGSRPGGGADWDSSGRQEGAGDEREPGEVAEAGGGAGAKRGHTARVVVPREKKGDAMRWWGTWSGRVEGMSLDAEDVAEGAEVTVSGLREGQVPKP